MIRPRAGAPAKAANASRSLRAVASGSRTEMTAALRQLAKAEGAVIDGDDGIERAWLCRRGATFPAAEHFLVTAPAGPEDKEGPGFRAAWQAATAPADRGPQPAAQLLLPLTRAAAA